METMSEHIAAKENAEFLVVGFSKYRVEPGEYDAEITDWGKSPTPFGYKVFLYFQLDAGPYENDAPKWVRGRQSGEPANGFDSPNDATLFAPYKVELRRDGRIEIARGGNLAKDYERLLGRRPSRNDRFSPKAMIGAKVRIQVRTVEKEPDGDAKIIGLQYSKVEKILRSLAH